MINFGTDGWRAVISDGFTFSNVRVVAQAIADYVMETSLSPNKAQKDQVKGDQPLIIIGYDTRFLSDQYAAECAQVLAANGIKVLLSDAVIPTPALSFAVKNHQAAGGIMITASHNPYQYNGIKYKASYGGSALPEIIHDIERNLYKSTPRIISLEAGKAHGLIEYFNGESDYCMQISKLVDLARIADAGQTIVIDPMHGAGAKYIKRLLETVGMNVIEIRAENNPTFGGINPEPILANLQSLVEMINKEKAQAGFATDGDADRVGAVDAAGAFVNSHIIYALLLKYLVLDRNWTGGVVKTFSTSQMIDKLAFKFGLPTFETPIGFKYICELFLTEDILLGGEESGGIGFKNHIPERDGILCSLLLMEMMATYGKSLNQLVEELMQEIGYHYYARLDLHLSTNAKEVMTYIKQAPKKIANLNIKEVLTLDGVKFILEDGSWILFRASGTEPLIRIYVEAHNQELAARILAEGQNIISHYL